MAKEERFISEIMSGSALFQSKDRLPNVVHLIFVLLAASARVGKGLRSQKVFSSRYYPPFK
ncbi:hypothetical protein JCM17380_43360 [Desulfosporosinus burensis]